MALIIPNDVGGSADVQINNNHQPQPPVNKPTSLFIPSDVGGIGENKTIENAPIKNDTVSRAVKELPELGAGGFDLFKSNGTTNLSKAKLATMFTTNPRELSNILRELSPDIGITETPEGDLIANNNETGKQFVINKPGLSVLDIIQGLGIAGLFTPGGALAQTAKTVGVKAGIGAISAGLTQGGIEVIQSKLGGELNADEIAIATSLGGIAEIVVPAIQAFRQARLRSQAGIAKHEVEAVAKQVKIADEASKATKVPLYQAQKTMLPAQLERQSFVAQLSAGTLTAAKQLKIQNEAAYTAVNEFLKSVAPSKSIITGSEKFRSAAQKAVERQKIIRSEKASPIYKAAFREGAKINLRPVKSLINSKLKDLPETGEIFKTLTKVTSLIANKKPVKVADSAIINQFGSPITQASTKQFPPSLKQIHNAKIEIDQMLNKFGDNSLGNTTKSELLEVKNILLEQIDKGSALYSQARKEFAKMSPDVEDISESIIGKLSNVDDVQLKSIARRLFDPAETNPKIISNAKKIINNVDPDAWNEILRVELERRIGSMRSTLESGTTENIPGQLFSAIFGNAKQRAVLFNAVDGNKAKNLKYLETVLNRARQGRPGGSQTATREDIKDELKGGVASVIRSFFSKPVSNLAGSGVSIITGASERAAFDKRVRALADIMFDPQWEPQISKLRKLNINSPASARAMIQLINDAEKTQKQATEDTKKEAVQ